MLQRLKVAITLPETQETFEEVLWTEAESMSDLHIDVVDLLLDTRGGFPEQYEDAQIEFVGFSEG